MRLIFGLILNAIEICEGNDNWQPFKFRGEPRYLKYAGEARSNKIKEKCENLEGVTLPAPRSSEENTELFQKLKCFGKEKIWLGINQVSNEWSEISSSEAINFTNWATGEPNGHSYAIFNYEKSDNGSWFGKSNSDPSLICMSKETVNPLCNIARLTESCQDDSILFRGTTCHKESISLLSRDGTKCDLEPFADDCGNLIFKANSTNAW